MEIIKAKPTLYNGIPMRSMLEARWARFLDYLNIEWVYEPQAYIFNDKTMYLPDFYLPKQDIFLEVKGIMTKQDMHKIECLVRESKKIVVIGYENGYFEIFGQIDENPNCIFLFTKGNSTLSNCLDCGNYWFYAESEGWDCKVCGSCNGNSHIGEIFTGNNNKKWIECFQKGKENGKR